MSSALRALLLVSSVMAAAAVPAAAADEVARGVEGRECERVACGADCWEVRAIYHRDGIQHQVVVGGMWGSFQGATCWADEISIRGFWFEQGEMQPTKVPPAALELLVLDRAVARADAADDPAPAARGER